MDLLGAGSQIVGEDYELDPFQCTCLLSRAESVHGRAHQIHLNIVAERLLGLPAIPAQAGACQAGSARFQRDVSGLGLTAVMNSEQPEQVTQLEALTAEVVAYGWKADLHSPAGRLPYLSVYDPADATAHGDVVAMPDSDSGHWWFWFTWAERITLVENPGVAAEIIVDVLRQPVVLE